MNAKTHFLNIINNSLIGLRDLGFLEHKTVHNITQQLYNSVIDIDKMQKSALESTGLSQNRNKNLNKTIDKETGKIVIPELKHPVGGDLDHKDIEKKFFEQTRGDL